LRVHLAVIAGLALASLLVWWHAWGAGSPTSTITCACGDPSQELWLFAWIPHALSHGMDPLFTNLLESGQGGVNIMWDANSLLLAFVLSPVTALFGPVASFNVAALLGPVVSGWCFFLAARKVSSFVPGQIAAAFLYGFAPFVIWNAPFGHVNLTWLFFPPLAFTLLYDLCFAPERRPQRIGRWLGALIVVQFFSGTEILAISGVGFVIGLVLTIVFAPRFVWALRRRFLIAGAWAVGISACVLAYPVFFAMFGPRHIVGLPWTPKVTQSESVPPATILNAGPSHLGNGILNQLGNPGAAGPPVGFLGIALVTGIIVSAIVWFRERLAWVLVGTAVVSIFVSFGPTLDRVAPNGTVILTQRSPWWLPGRWLAHVPVVQDILPSRFASLTIFAVALLLTISADRWWRFRAPLARWLRAEVPSLGWGAAVTAVTAVVLFPVVATYGLPFAGQRDPTPAWFTTDTAHLRPRTRVLVLPTDFATVTRVMSWQAEKGLPFALEGGYAVTPKPNAGFKYSLTPLGAGAVLDNLAANMPEPGTPGQAALVRSALERWGVGVVIVVDQGGPADYSAAYLTAVLGRMPEYVAHSWVWRNVGRAPSLQLTASALATCDSATNGGLGSAGATIHPFAFPLCVAVGYGPAGSVLTHASLAVGLSAGPAHTVSPPSVARFRQACAALGTSVAEAKAMGIPNTDAPAWTTGYGQLAAGAARCQSDVSGALRSIGDGLAQLQGALTRAGVPKSAWPS